MFPVQCKENLPIERLVISSIAVRGALGPITIWVSNDPEQESTQNVARGSAAVANAKRKRGNIKDSKTKSCQKSCNAQKTPVSPPTDNKKTSLQSQKPKLKITATKSQWTKIYSGEHAASFNTYVDIDISDNPVYLKPGQVRGIYVHSSLPNDEGIVYDNYHSHVDNETPEDDFLCIKPGMAHLSPSAFGSTPIWGWGDAWRPQRKFVGKLEYGVVYKLWNPKHHLVFGSKFQTLTMLLFACQRRFESPLSRLPDDCIFYILNMCKWDWVGDDSKGMKDCLVKRKKRFIRRQKILEDEMKVNALKSNNDEDENGEQDLLEDTKQSSTQDQEMKEAHENNNDYEDDYDEDWEEEVYESEVDDDDEEDAVYFERNESRIPVLYQDEDSVESAPKVRHRYVTRASRHGSRGFRINRHIILTDFISAMMHGQERGSDDDDSVEP